jgi:hypothetical protein
VGDDGPAGVDRVRPRGAALALAAAEEGVKRWRPFALFAAVALVATGPGLVGTKTLFDMTTANAQLGTPAPPGWEERGDTAFLLPMLLDLYNDGLKHNELRLWNPRLFCGYPITSDPMVHAFYPPQILLHRALPVHGAYHAFLLLHLFFAGASMALLLRGLGRSEGAVVAGGLLWQLTGYSAHWFSTTILAGTSVFGPLAVLGLVRGRPLLSGAALGLSILGSHPQHALYVFVFVLAWGLAVERRPRHVLIAGLAALLVGLPEILARLESIEHGFRDPTTDSKVLYGSGAVLVQALLGLVAGPALPLHGILRSEFPLFAGLAACALAVGAGVRRRADPRVRFLAIAGGIMLLLAFLPAFTILSQPSRWLHVFAFALVLLAAEGWDALAEKPGRSWAWVAGAAVALLGVVLIIGRPFPLPLAAGFAAVALFFAFPKPALGLAAILLELGPPFLAINGWSDRVPDRAGESPNRVAGSLGTSSLNPWNVAVGGNLLARRGRESLGGYEAIVPTDYVSWFVEAGGQVFGGGRVLALTDFSSPKLDEAGLRWLFLSWPELDPGPRWTVVLDGPNRIYENRNAWPRERLETPSGSLRVNDRVPGRLEASVQLSAPTRLVVAENAYPGWRARIDGAVVPLERSGPWQAVPVPGGNHEVLLEYRPDALRIGFPISALALILCLASAILPPGALWKSRAAGRSIPSSSFSDTAASPPPGKS